MGRFTAVENVDTYVSQIREFPLIPREEENRLAGLIRTGTPEESRAAKELLVEANLRLVVKIAHDFKDRGLGFADLISEGNIGLMTAADKFDPSRGAKFSCYAAWWIKQSMRRAISWQARVIRIPGGSLQHLSKLNRARAAWAAEHGEEPDTDTLAALSGLPADTVGMLGRAATETLSMDDRISPDSDATFGSMLSEREAAGSRDDRIPELLSEVSGLTDLDAAIVRGSFGLDSPSYSELELARLTGIPMAGVRERLAAALIRLRNHLTAERGPCVDAAL